MNCEARSRAYALTSDSVCEHPATLKMAWRSASRRQLLTALFLTVLTTACAEAVSELSFNDVDPDRVMNQLQVWSIHTVALYIVSNLCLGMLSCQSPQRPQSQVRTAFCICDSPNLLSPLPILVACGQCPPRYRLYIWSTQLSPGTMSTEH